MQTLVIGCGTVGSNIAAMLCKEGHNVTVLEQKRDLVEAVTEKLDVMGICGSGVSIEDLIEAGVKDMDLVISAMDSDESNFISCMIARKAAGCQTIARVSNMLFADDAHFLKEELGLSMVINPKLSAAMAITRMLKYPAAQNVETFAGGRVELSDYRIREGSMLIGVPLKNIYSHIHCNVLVCVVERGGNVFIPGGDFVLQAGDRISVVADNHNIMQFLKKVGFSMHPVHRVMIVGGSSTAEYLTALLLDLRMEVILIDSDRARCEELSGIFPKATIIHEDGTNRDVLMEEGIMNCDAFVSLTARDEENILLSLYVKSICDAKVITRMHHVSYDRLIDSFEVGSIIVPQKIAANAVLRYVRAMNNSLDSNVETLYQLCDGRVEALEFVIKDAGRIVGVPLRDIQLKDQVIIAAIIRGRKVIIPGGADSIVTGDRVIVITAHTGVGDINDILR